LSAEELARRLGLSKASARQLALKVGYQVGDSVRSGAGRRTKEAAKKAHAERLQFFRGLSPGLTVGQLAQRMGVSTPTARKYAVAFKYRLVKGKRGRPRGQRKSAEKRAINNPPWVNVDWSLKDIEIAQRVGVSRERVRQVRRELGLPPSRRGRSVGLRFPVGEMRPRYS